MGVQVKPEIRGETRRDGRTGGGEGRGSRRPRRRPSAAPRERPWAWGRGANLRSGSITLLRASPGFRRTSAQLKEVAAPLKTAGER